MSIRYFSIRVMTSLPFDYMTLINLYTTSYRDEILRSSMTYCFKYFLMINFAKKTNALMTVDLLVGAGICT